MDGNLVSLVLTLNRYLLAESFWTEKKKDYFVKFLLIL